MSMNYGRGVLGRAALYGLGLVLGVMGPFTAADGPRLEGGRVERVAPPRWSMQPLHGLTLNARPAEGLLPEDLAAKRFSAMPLPPGAADVPRPWPGYLVEWCPAPLRFPVCPSGWGKRSACVRRHAADPIVPLNGAPAAEETETLPPPEQRP
jgi:hypothetical protein